MALAHDGQVEYAVVYDPFKDELFSASRGGGAFRNGSPIHVSTLPLSQGIFGMGTAIYKRENIAPTMRLTEQLMNRSCDFRRLGAAALDLCNVAWRPDRGVLRIQSLPLGLCPPGSLIITEAGRPCVHPGGHSPAHYRALLRLGQQDINKDVLKELTV